MPLGTLPNDELRNGQLNRHFWSLNYISCCGSIDCATIMCGLIPHYDEEMAGEKFDFQPNGNDKPSFTSAI